MDLNKSIIMSDLSAGRDVYQTLNSLLSECIYGLVPYNIFKSESFEAAENKVLDIL